MSTTTVNAEAPPETGLSLTRLYLMRFGYLFMGAGLVLVKWPLLPEADALPLYEGVTLCLLTAMSLLALLGLRHPVKLLPVLLFETIWKLIWIALVAVPAMADRRLDGDTADVFVNCLFVVVIAAVTPWGYVWSNFLRGPSERWR